jgi:hypothetical protein
VERLGILDRLLQLDGVGAGGLQVIPTDQVFCRQTISLEVVTVDYLQKELGAGVQDLEQPGKPTAIVFYFSVRFGWRSTW